jgi:hypothetical protein
MALVFFNREKSTKDKKYESFANKSRKLRAEPEQPMKIVALN